MSSSLRPSTVVAATVGTAVTGFLAYALYFDYRRRNDPEFRKQLKRQSKRTAKAAKAEAEESNNRDRKELRAMVDEANEEGYPEKAEDKEAYFMDRLQEGESLCTSRTFESVLLSPSFVLLTHPTAEANRKEAALCFFKALKVYPTPKEIMSLYDRTVPKVTLSERYTDSARLLTSAHRSFLILWRKWLLMIAPLIPALPAHLQDSIKSASLYIVSSISFIAEQHCKAFRNTWIDGSLKDMQLSYQR